MNDLFYNTNKIVSGVNKKPRYFNLESFRCQTIKAFIKEHVVAFTWKTSISYLSLHHRSTDLATLLHLQFRLLDKTKLILVSPMVTWINWPLQILSQENCKNSLLSIVTFWTVAVTFSRYDCWLVDFPTCRQKASVFIHS